jgi:Na+-translocating ferredoxin:NAD+ oxidoreductase RnfA subunit
MDNPYTTLEKKDIVHKFLSLCSFISICENKKLNLANVFLLVLKNKKYRDLFKEILIIESNYDLVKLFLQHDPYLYKSKYITKFLKKHTLNL